MNKGQGQSLALIGGLGGLGCGLLLMSLRIILSSEPLRSMLLGDLIFGAVYVLPFALALIALRWGNPTQRIASWMAAGVLAVLGSVTAFSGITLIFLPAAPLLLIAAVRAIPGNRVRHIAFGVGLAVLMIFLNASAFRVLFLQQDGVCWQKVRSEDGREVWESIPYSQSGTTTASPSGSEPGIIGTLCSSDSFSPIELMLSVGLLALTAGSWVAVSFFDNSIKAVNKGVGEK